MPLTQAELMALCSDVLSCSSVVEVDELVTSREGAAGAAVQALLAAIAMRNEPPPGAITIPVCYFDSVVNKRVRERARPRSRARRRTIPPPAERVAAAQRAAIEEIGKARSWSELVQALAVAFLNAIDAEVPEPRPMHLEPRFHPFLDLANALANGPDAVATAGAEWRTAMRAAAGQPVLERLFRDVKDLLSAGEWRDLPLLGDSVTTLRRGTCEACGATSWRTFWNYIGLWDGQRRKQLVDGELNVLRCVHCGSERFESNVITAIHPALRLAALPSFVCCETEGSLVFLTPPELGRHDPEIGVAVHSLAMHLARQSPRGRRGDLEAWDLTFTPKQFRRKIRETSESTDPKALSDAYKRRVLVPLARRVQAGEVPLDAMHPEIARAIEDFRFTLPRGLIVTRGDFESRDPSLAALDALVGFLDEQCEYFLAASATYTTGAEEAVSAGRWGDASWLIERAEQTADKSSPNAEVRRYLRQGAALQRASLHFQMGDAGRAAEEMREIVAFQRELLSRRMSDLTTLALTIDLAGSLNSAGDYLVRRDLATCRRMLRESLDLCERAAASPLFARLPERSKQFWALTQSGALNNFARSCQEAKLAMIVAARISAHHGDIDHDSVRWYFEEGVTSGQLQANLEAIRDEFPAYLDHRRWINYEPLSEELDRAAEEHYRRALEISTKFGLHRYAALQWSNLARLHESHGRGRRALTCARRAEDAARRSGHLPAIVEATFTMADLLDERGDRAAARGRLVEAYELWARMRRLVVFDELRIAAGRQIAPILDRIGRTIDGAPPDEWIGTLERMKAGSLADSILAPPLRLAGATDDELQRLHELERRIVAARMQAEAGQGTGVRAFFRSRAAAAELRQLEREHESLRESLLLRRPYLGGSAPEGESSAGLVAALRRRYAGAAFIGLWLHRNDLLVYGLTPKGHSFAFRHPFLDALRTHVLVPLPEVDDYLGAYRATAATDLPADNLPETIGAGWFRALWPAIEEHTGPIERAVISPHGRLRGFPWATMWTGAAWAVSGTVFSEVVAVTAKEPAPRPSRPRRILLLADPDLGDPELALPGAREEAEWIRGAAEPAGVAIDVRVGKEATAEALFAAAPEADVIHLACHGSFDRHDPWSNALYLSGGAVSTTEIAHNLRLRPGALVVLSACDTGKAQYRAADEAAGLARSFHLAGASDVIAALWPVDDDATVQLMTGFYQALLFGSLRPAEALASAQRSMIRMAGGVEVLKHWGRPCRWGAFLLYER